MITLYVYRLQLCKLYIFYSLRICNSLKVEYVIFYMCIVSYTPGTGRFFGVDMFFHSQGRGTQFLQSACPSLALELHFQTQAPRSLFFGYHLNLVACTVILVILTLLNFHTIPKFLDSIIVLSPLFFLFLLGVQGGFLAFLLS